MADDLTSMSDDTLAPAPDSSAAREPDNPPEHDQELARPVASAEDEDEDANAAQRDEMVGDPYAALPDPHEGAVPPGYDWPTHGGYLGCLLGSVAACAITGFLGGTWFAILAAPSWVRLTITLVVAVAAFVGLGRLGWVLGRRYYREYPQPVSGVGGSPLAGDAARTGASPRE